MSFNVWMNKLEEKQAFACSECEDCEIHFPGFEEGPTVKLCPEHKPFLADMRERLNRS